ncbi:MAG: cyanophycin synthetase [Parcubacteria group bacterium Greene0714_21]|nr:MAG: cyanophycin synthetase [Parcubacteria group bacterium Greene0416_39]TSD04071.1 MAG: cyanophycin synthetase [Parcubacteria group bacterium Greene0714_21]
MFVGVAELEDALALEASGATRESSTLSFDTMKNFCKDCGYSNFYHLTTWLQDLTSRFLWLPKLPKKIEDFFDGFLATVFTVLRIAKFRADFTAQDVQLRSFCFLEEMKKRGVTCYALKTIFGYTNHFKMRIGEKVFHFEMLPTAGFKSKYTNRVVDDKQLTKEFCKEGNFPISQGQSFWFWQKQKAVQFAHQIGFPVVVKPRGGSVSRHVTTNIEGVEQLECAIRKATAYSPAFIVEKFIPNTFVYRATVVDFDFVVCVQQLPANVVGNGILTVRELIDKKNNSPNRGPLRSREGEASKPHQKEHTLYTIVENAVTETLLSKKGYTFFSVPKESEVVFLQYDPFLKLGGDLVEVTNTVHPDNLTLVKQAARYFDIRVVGIDFLAQDISRSWKEQQCAILELNSAPCIELHHFPSAGEPTNPAKALADMFFKYYT